MIRFGYVLRGAGRSISPFAWLGLAMTALALAVALFGPFFRPLSTGRDLRNFIR